jgi:hypothetical protein
MFPLPRRERIEVRLTLSENASEGNDYEPEKLGSIDVAELMVYLS